MGLRKIDTQISIEDYLEGEKISQIKHEYLDGKVYAMAGASLRHNIIAGNIYSKLNNHLEDSDCVAFIESVKLQADESTFYYPDVIVSCEETPDSEYVLEEPILLVEVLSPSTERIDRSEKLKTYKSIPSVQEYLIIEQEKIHIELHRRQPDGTWLTHFYNKSDHDEIIEFQSVGMEITLDEIYRRVKF